MLVLAEWCKRSMVRLIHTCFRNVGSVFVRLLRHPSFRMLATVGVQGLPDGKDAVNLPSFHGN